MRTAGATGLQPSVSCVRSRRCPPSRATSRLTTALGPVQGSCTVLVLTRPAVSDPLVRRQGIRQSFFGKITLKKTSSPHECKPSCVNPTPFLPTTHRRLWIHIRKSLNAGTSEKKTEPLARNQVFTFFGLDVTVII